LALVVIDNDDVETVCNVIIFVNRMMCLWKHDRT